MKLAFTALLLAAMPLAGHAREHVTIASSIPYASNAIGNAEVRAECDWNGKLSSYITTYARGEVTATDQDLSTIPGEVLVIHIDRVHVAGGGGFSGPKWAIIRGELKDHGRVINSFRMRRVSDRLFGFSACGVLDHLAKALGSDVARWVASGHPDQIEADER